MATLEKIRASKRLLEELEKKELEKFEGKKVLGFKLKRYVERKKSGDSYPYWRAYISVKGKKYFVHMTDPTMAEEKILAYIEKKPELKEYIQDNFC